MATHVVSGLEPAVARRLLRHEIARMCREAGFTHTHMGARLSVSRASFSQLISGKNLPHRATLEIIAQHCGAEHRTPMLIDILTAARTRNQRPVTTGVHDSELAIGLEAFATHIEVYDPTYVTPLLQTPDYARACLTAHAQLHPELNVAQQLDQLIRRQRVLDHAELTWVTEQTALLRPIAPPDVLADQLRHLHTMAAHPNITIHITAQPAVPVAAFHIITATDGTTTAHQQTLLNAHYYDDLGTVADYTRLMKHLRAHTLDAERSRALMAHVVASRS